MGQWNYIRLAAGDRSIPVFTVIPVMYTIAESPLESLLQSLLECLLESLFKCLLEGLLETASHREE
jgi:hypothetical protein